MPEMSTMQTLCCGCCAACSAVGLATLVFVAYICYYVLTAIFGCIIIVYGVLLRNLLLSYTDFIEASEGDYLLYSSLCIAIGTMFTVVVILGVCAQRTNQSKLMVVSSVIQLAVLVTGIYTYFWAYPGTEKVGRFLSSGFDNALTKYPGTAAAWDSLQVDMECCGKLNFISWKGVNSPDYPPTSCCREYNRMETCSHDADYTNAGRSAITLNVLGCLPKVQDLMSRKMKTLQGLLIPFLIITLIGFFSSLCNAKAKKAESTEGTKVGGLYVNVPKIKDVEVVEVEDLGEMEKLEPTADAGAGDEEKKAEAEAEKKQEPEPEGEILMTVKTVPKKDEQQIEMEKI